MFFFFFWGGVSGLEGFWGLLGLRVFGVGVSGSGDSRVTELGFRVLGV